MHTVLINGLSALTIGVIIGLMAQIHNVRLKATIYALPIPITVALIATRVPVDSSNIVGLALICGFIWLTKQLHSKANMHIVLADALSALAYIAIGFIFVKTMHLNFALAVALYLVGWAIVIGRLHAKPATEKPVKPSTLSPYTKGIGTTVISFIMFSLKDTLAGIVITFPFSGVFAVLETKGHLELFFRIVARNTLAILSLFITIYVLQSHYGLFVDLVAAWIVYFIVLKLVQKISV